MAGEENQIKKILDLFGSAMQGETRLFPKIVAYIKEGWESAYRIFTQKAIEEKT